ncbi:hypothetical protein EES40_05770 [Streptomyces sp. ADI93-02]|nr:hypothetical protein EES40_05770 [Streptomyces sp. ADI93-02]
MTLIDASKLTTFEHAATEADIIHSGGFTLARAQPYTRLRGTTWDPHDVARQRGAPIVRGRQADILYGAEPFPVTTRRDPNVIRPFALSAHTAPCNECAADFTVERRRGTRRPWPKTCPGCVAHRKRRLTAERARRHRARNAKGA